ncbi:hypothetical protein HPP92_014536 [Vanilla planifolia]|uniref:Uncharacterized protein n=1 Tax=Vanilla planifolia TaxID=51239 RepID=A0A835UWB5_VANPL|nr:hypothetical protein HPP92_014536 [Vanilla planifolia]
MATRSTSALTSDASKQRRRRSSTTSRSHRRRSPREHVGRSAPQRGGRRQRLARRQPAEKQCAPRGGGRGRRSDRRIRN